MKATRSLPLRCLALVASAALVGCGTSEYQSRMETTLAAYGRIAKFDELTPPIQMAGGNVTIRVPKKFKRKYRYGEPGIETTQNISPPFLLTPLPGATLGFVDTATDSQHYVTDYHCYVAVIETAPEAPGVKKLVEVIQEELVKAFPKANPPPAWQQTAVKCETDEGDVPVREWYTISVKDEQKFNRVQNGILEYVNMPGTFELWLHQTADYTVMMAWRVPEGISGAINLQDDPRASTGKPPLMWRDAAKLMGGSLKITTPAAFAAEPIPTPGDEVRVGSYKVRLPAGFKPAAAPPGAKPNLPAGSTMGFWSLDPATMLMGVSLATPANQLAPSLEQTLGTGLVGALGALGGGASARTGDTPQHGLINGNRFVRAKYGIGIGNAMVHATLYVGADGNNRVIFFGVSADENNVKAMSGSILSATK